MNTKKSVGSIWLDVKERDKRKKLASWVRQKRKDAGLTLDQAALKIGYQSAAAIKRIEIGYESIPAKRIIDFAAAYDIPMPELLEKLRDLAPRTAADFDFLEKRFSAYFLHMYKTMESEGKAKAGKRAGLHMSNYQTPGYSEHPWHHKEFPNNSDMLNCFNWLTKIYIIRHWKRPYPILTTARRLFAKIHNITILSNLLPFLVKGFPCLDSALSIEA